MIMSKMIYRVVQAPWKDTPVRNFVHTILIGVLLLCGAHPLAGAGTAEGQVLKGHIPAVIGRMNLQSTGALPATNRLNLAVSLPLRHSGDLTNLLQRLYDPASPDYRKFITPDQFAERFGPAPEDYDALKKFAADNGLNITGASPNRMLLDVNLSVADIQRVFHVRMLSYQRPSEGGVFYAPEAEPSIDSAIPIAHVSGLDNYRLPRPAFVRRPPPGGRRQPSQPGLGSSPDGQGEYFGYDFRDAYVPGVALDGSGQTLALLELDGYFATDIQSYENEAGLRNVPLVNVPVNGFSGTPTSMGGDIEISLDIDMAVAMAPGLDEILVYEQENGAYPLTDILTRIATDDLANQISCSWLIGDEPSWDAIYLQFAAQGQSFFQAAGDNGSYNWSDPFQQQVDDPNITIVGGTTLSTTGPLGSWVSETVWNWNVEYWEAGDAGTNGAGGGGISPNYTIPTWQQGLNMSGNMGSTNYRNIPDVALAADNVYVEYGQGQSVSLGGTSCAAPLWAGFMALVNQQNATVGNAPAGFPNPALYALARGANYSACFHDIITGNNTNSDNPSQFFAAPGYDLCTGWGTPAGSNLIKALAAPADVLEITPYDGFSAGAAPGGPLNQAPRIFLLTNAGTTALTWTLANPAAWLTASPTGGALPARGFTNVTVSLNAAIAGVMPEGLYTANLWFTNESDGVVQSRRFTLTLAEPQLVENGGFETGDFHGWTLVGDTVQFDSIYDAVVDTNAILLAVHSGNWGAFLGDIRLATLSQPLATVSGQYYLLSLWLDNPISGPGQEFLVNWNTDDDATNTIYGLINPPEFDWTNLKFIVLGAGSRTVL
jgi:hypothetical protein